MSTAAYALNAFRRLAADDLQGGSVQYPLSAAGAATATTTTWPAAVTPFELRQILTEGGFTPRLQADATVARGDIGGTVFKTGQFILATRTCDPDNPRVCQIENVIDLGPTVQLTLTAQNQNA